MPTTNRARAQSSRPSRLAGYVGGPYKVVAREVTGDDHLDLVIGYHNVGVVLVEAGNGKGQFTRAALNDFSDKDRKLNPNDKTWSEPHIHNLALADVDGDGREDLLVSVGGRGRTKKGRVLLARNIGGGRFEKRIEFAVPSEAKGVRLVDLDRDGQLDALYTARGSGYKDDLTEGRLYLRRGRGPWRFGPARIAAAGKSAYYVETADLNQDGFLDIIVPNEHDSCATYFLSPGKSIFADKELDQEMEKEMLARRTARATPIPNRRSHAVNDVRAGDFNGDGIQDLLTANLGTSTVSLFLGKGDGSFAKDVLLEAGKNGAFLAVGDLDRDGDLDFVITHWTEDFASVFLNRGKGAFAARKDYKTGSGNYGVDLADLNHDGYLDAVTANYRAKSISVLFGAGDGTFRRAVTTPKGLRTVKGKWLPWPERP